MVRPPKSSGKRGRRRSVPRVARRRPACQVRDLLSYSPVFRDQSWQRYRIADTSRGPNVWEIKWAVFYRKDERGLPSRRHTLIVARNVLTGEVKFFLCNRVPGERNPVTGEVLTLRDLLRVAFGRWPIESGFRETKEELGLDHFEVRGWRCVHRHFFLTQLTHLFCARVRQELDTASSGAEPRAAGNELTIEQVRSAMDVWLDAANLPRAARLDRYQKEINQQTYHQQRNAQARKSHTKTRRHELQALGIRIDRIKSCVLAPSEP